MITRFWVFVSSTSDLLEERQAIAASLPRSFEPYLYEQDRSRDQAPQERLSNVLDQTDVYIGVFGNAYGSPYPNSETPGSIVEWEFDQARHRPAIERFGFVKEEMGAPVDERQQGFRQRLTAFDEGLWCKSFRSTDELVDLVKDSLLEWLGEFVRGVRNEEQKMRGPGLGLVSLTALPAVGLLLLLLSSWKAVVPIWALAGFTILSLLAVAGALIATNLDWRSVDSH